MKRATASWMASLPVVLLAVVAGHYVYDRPLAVFFAGITGGVVYFFQTVTYLGESTLYLVVSGLLFLCFVYVLPQRRQARKMLYLFSAVAVSGLVANLVKWLMGRWRPNMFSPQGLYGFEFFGVGYGQTSFPSGHATTICAVAFALAVLFPRWRCLWGAVAVLVAGSRVVIGAHYASDVVMGAYVGILTAFLLWRWPFFRESIDEGG